MAMEWSGMTQMPSEQPEEDEGERMEMDASTPFFGDFPPSVRRENLLYYPPTSEPF